MDIAGASINMAGSKLMQKVGIAVAGKAMDQAEIQAQGILQMAQTAVPPTPGLGENIDISV